MSISNLLSVQKLIIMREFSRVQREPSRIIGMLLQPLMFLLVFGVGFDQSFIVATQTHMRYSAFFYPGILGLVVLFAAIYATLTLVDDKKCGFFRLLLVSPVGIRGALMGKVLATALLGFLQSLLFLPLAYVLKLKPNLVVILVLFIGSFCFALIGVLFAWLCSSSSAFHALMSIILIPMWLLSGAMFPLDNKILDLLSIINPMAYLVRGLRYCFLESGFIGRPVFILLVFCLLFIFLLDRVSKRKSLSEL